MGSNNPARSERCATSASNIARIPDFRASSRSSAAIESRSSETWDTMTIIGMVSVPVPTTIEPHDSLVFGSAHTMSERDSEKPRWARTPPWRNELPDARDGLTHTQRIVLHTLHGLQCERGGGHVPTALLYGRVCDKVDLTPQELQQLLAELSDRS